ncbi:MAG: hypothetical protein Q7R32_04005 [Dehalococcoidia bacterium]|nr:hypothetical protein [Dehalococcoidia bacterium]
MKLDDLKELIANTDPNATYEWEIDIAPIRSQQPGKAWPAYAEMVKNYGAAFEPTVYGRWVRYPDRIALQYWYLYTYNDAGNYHEGDWETVAIELATDGTPTRAGYSGHQGGFQQPWARVQKTDGRPIVYVARGSHASYFEHRKKGHRTKSLANPKGLPWLVDLIVRRVHKRIIDAIVWLRWNDHTPTHPDYPGSEPWNRGDFVSPRLLEMPQLDDVGAEGPFWWMRIQCRWGSRHSRLRGSAAPYPAWEKRRRYDDPLGWIDGLDRERG